MDLDLCPVLRGGIEKESGNSFFSMIPSKMLYMQKDLERSAAYFGIPLKAIEVYSIITFSTYLFAIMYIVFKFIL